MRFLTLEEIEKNVNHFHDISKTAQDALRLGNC